MLIATLLCACSDETVTRYDTGVSRDLATMRKASIEGLRYGIDIDLVENTGKVNISFLLNQKEDIVVDFRATDNILDVKLNSKEVKHEIYNEHIVVASSELETGENTISVAFKVDNQSLNRND